jgi:hypothetical protein
LSIDDKRLDELITESQDLQSSAMQSARETLPALEDLAHTDRPEATDPEAHELFHFERRRLMRNGGLGIGALAAAGLGGTGFGTLLTSILAGPAAAQSSSAASSDLSIQIFQTACSLENLAVATYGAALTLPFFGANAVVVKFAQTTMQQHHDHSDAFNKQVEMLGGTRQDGTNPKYTPVVEQMKAGLTDYAAVVALASTLEEVAQDTYLANLSLLTDGDMRQLMASVMAVETQHLATLRAVGALLATPELIAIPTDLAKLPAAAGSVAFPKPFEEPNLASPPQEGAIK